MKLFYCTFMKFDTKGDCIMLFNITEVRFCDMRQDKYNNYGTFRFGKVNLVYIFRYGM